MIDSNKHQNIFPNNERTFLIATTRTATLGRSDGSRPTSELSDAHASVPTSPAEHKVVLEGIDAAIDRAGGQVTPQNAGSILSDAAAAGGVELPTPDQDKPYGPEPAPPQTDLH